MWLPSRDASALNRRPAEMAASPTDRAQGTDAVAARRADLGNRRAKQDRRDEQDFPYCAGLVMEPPEHQLPDRAWQRQAEPCPAGHALAHEGSSDPRTK
jgi:hypothetical protein